MTSESFAADMGNMIGDGSDLAPLMGTFSFSGRDPNAIDDQRDEESEEEEIKQDQRESLSTIQEDSSSRKTEVIRASDGPASVQLQSDLIEAHLDAEEAKLAVPNKPVTSID